MGKSTTDKYLQLAGWEYLDSKGYYIHPDRPAERVYREGEEGNITHWHSKGFEKIHSSLVPEYLAKVEVKK